MPQAQDFLTGLLNSSLSLDPDATSTFFGNDPVRAAADRSSSVDAIMHAINTGQPPTAVASPSYGPIGALLQKLNIRSSEKPVSPRLSDQIGIAQKEYGSAQQDDREAMLKTLQNQETIGGGESARTAAGVMGHPELEPVFAKDTKGKGELAQGSQDLMLQKLINSQDLQEQKMGLQEMNMQMREALMNNNLSRADQLMNLRERGVDLKENQAADAPTMKLGSELMQSLDRQEAEAQRQLDTYLSGGTGEDGDANAQRIQARIDLIEKRRLKLMSGYGSYKTPKDMMSIYQDDDTKPAPKKGSVKPAPAGLFD